MAAVSKVISFRLEESLYQQLSEEARSEGVSVNEMAKRRATTTSVADDMRTLKMELTALRSQISELRKDVAIGVEALLANGGRLSQQAAKVFVDEMIRKSM